MNIFRLLLGFLVLFLSSKIYAQATPNPCEFDKFICGVADQNKLFTSFENDTIVYAAPGRSMPFWFALGDSVSGIIDTTGFYNFSLSKVSGPGPILGVPGTASGYYSYLDDISFSAVGTYVISVNVSGFPGSFVGKLVFEVPPEVNFCPESPGGSCINGGGNKIFVKPQSSNVIPVDAVMPVKVGVIDSISGNLDYDFIGEIYVEKASGPGQVYGTLSMSGERWFNFTNLRFSAEGIYTIRFFELDSGFYTDALMNVEVVEISGVNQVVSVDGVDLYPNPINDKVTISAQSNLNGSTIEIFSYSGQKVFEKNIIVEGNQTVINTGSLTKGVYMLTVSKENGSSWVVKIIK